MTEIKSSLMGASAIGLTDIYKAFQIIDLISNKYIFFLVYNAEWYGSIYIKIPFVPWLAFSLHSIIDKIGLKKCRELTSNTA